MDYNRYNYKVANYLVFDWINETVNFECNNYIGSEKVPNTVTQMIPTNNSIHDIVFDNEKLITVWFSNRAIRWRSDDKGIYNLNTKVSCPQLEESNDSDNISLEDTVVEIDI